MSTLRVHVVRARSLVAKDWSLLASRRRSDPYVVVVVDGTVVGKTAVAPKNLDPEWGEAFQAWVPGNGDANVELRIVDRDLVTDDESMGAVKFAVPRSGAAPFAWRPVAKTADCKNAKGDLFCAAAFRPAAAGPDAAWTLTVHGARHLPAADAGGTSDPFAVVEVEDEGGPGKGGSGFDEVGRTAVAWKTLQPTWDHAVDFDAPAGLAPGAGDPRDLEHLLARGPAARLRLYDKDRYSKDDALGQCLFAVGALPRDGSAESTFGGLFQKHAKPQEKAFDDDGDESDATGGMVCAFALNGKGATTLAFFNAHLAAHEGKALRRDADVAEILGGCRSKLGGAYSSKLDVSAQVDYAMFVGDLNYRVLRGSTDALRSPTASPAAKRTAATFRPADDELSVEMAAKRVFVGWAAPPPAFAPTFKVAKGGGTYNAKRAPSWCDRVLVHESAALKGTATVETFDARPAVASSDHKPVAAVLSLAPPPRRAATLRRARVADALAASVAVLAPGGGSAAFRRGREPLAFDAAVAPGAVVHVAFSTDDRPAGAASLSLADLAAAVDADGAYAVTAPLVLNGLQDRGDVALTFAAA
ncbi:hypothetical protein JL720_880 [Aureococcus anophagefferens]|nr:hypothetical protein JL720_880 [Aureococcus anophagefferens]